MVSQWSTWTDCDTRCGIGMMSRYRNVTAEPSNGGDKCPNLKEMRGCMGFDCTDDERAAIKGAHAREFIQKYRSLYLLFYLNLYLF